MKKGFTLKKIVSGSKVVVSGLTVKLVKPGESWDSSNNIVLSEIGTTGYYENSSVPEAQQGMYEVWTDNSGGVADSGLREIVGTLDGGDLSAGSVNTEKLVIDADLDFNGHKAEDIGDPSTETDAASYKLLKAQGELIVKMHNSDLTFRGFASPTSDMPGGWNVNDAWIVTADGSVLGVSATKGQVIVDTGDSYVVEDVVGRSDSSSGVPYYTNNSTMDGSTDWEGGYSPPPFDVDTTTPGKMRIEFVSGANNEVLIKDKVKSGQELSITVKAKLISGAGMPVRLGEFKTALGTGSFDITPTSTEQEFQGTIIQTDVHQNISIMGMVATNNGSVIEFDDFVVEVLDKVTSKAASDIETIEGSLVTVEALVEAVKNVAGKSSIFEKHVEVENFGSADLRIDDFISSLKITGANASKKYYLKALFLHHNINNNLYVSIADEDDLVVLEMNHVGYSIPTNNFLEINIPEDNDSGVTAIALLDFTKITDRTGYPDTTSINWGTNPALTLADTQLNINCFKGLITESDMASALSAKIAKIESNESNIASNAADLLALSGGIHPEDNESTMLLPNDWVAGLGSPTFDCDTTVAGKMYIVFSAGTNQQIKLTDKLVSGLHYGVKIKAKLISGGGAMSLRCGFFAGTVQGYNFDVVPEITEKIFEADFIQAPTSPDFSIGALAAVNDGSEVEIDYVICEIYKTKDEDQDAELDALAVRLADVEADIDTINTAAELYTPKSFYTEEFMQSLSKYDKPLIKFAVCGDSLMANRIGGAIPVEHDEGATMRPMRLTTNGVPRRVYDFIKFNPATYRRLDHADWAKSGTWTSADNGETIYHSSIVSGAYVEIIVPDGMEDFAIVCNKNDAMGVINFTLNGGSIAAYGNASVDLQRTPLSGSDAGNPHHIETFYDLPAGANTIRISKEANTEEVNIWGGFYWSGVTLLVDNLAHGGHNMDDLLSQHLIPELIENSYDAILFELPIMNEAGHGGGLELSKASLVDILDNYVNGKDVCFMSCNIMGEKPGDDSTNYYTINSDPAMLPLDDAFRRILYDRSIPFIDVFHFFRLKTENRSGTLEGGEAGLWWTADGQHPNADGCREWFNMIQFAFKNKPITQ